MLKRHVPSIGFEWTVLETNALCGLAQKRLIADPMIRWVSSPAEVDESFDVVLLSGVIQCVENPIAMLDFAMQKAPVLIVNRIPLSSSKPKICVQRPGVFESKGSYPSHIFNEDEMLAYLSSRGKILARWYVPEDIAVVRLRRVVYQGLTFHVGP